MPALPGGSAHEKQQKSAKRHDSQSQVTFICRLGKRLTNAVRSQNGGSGASLPSKSVGSGTIDRADGTNTASQSPVWGPTGEDFIGPSEFLCTIEVWSERARAVERR